VGPKYFWSGPASNMRLLALKSEPLGPKMQNIGGFIKGRAAKGCCYKSRCIMDGWPYKGSCKQPVEYADAGLIHGWQFMACRKHKRLLKKPFRLRYAAVEG
jgi:hypothetical protein